MIYLYGNDTQISEITLRLLPELKYQAYNLKVSLKIPEVNTDDIHIVADKEQFDILSSTKQTGYTILEYYLFKEVSSAKIRPSSVCNNISTIILGMSHSQCGIDTGTIDQGRVLKLSKPSMDLFLQLNLLNSIDSIVDKDNIKEIYFELPYYIFNYDLSRFKPFVYSKLNYFYEFDNFHHLQDDSSFGGIKYQYELYMKLFAQNVSSKVVSKRSKITRIIQYLRYKYKSTIDIINNRDAVWCKTYNQTIVENTELFRQILVYFQDKYPKAKITILVMPFNPLFRFTHRNSIRKTKTIFYEIMKMNNLEVIDHFNHYLNPFMFDDHCHLSKKGAKVYTNYLINNYLKWN